MSEFSGGWCQLKEALCVGESVAVGVDEGSVEENEGTLLASSHHLRSTGSSSGPEEVRIELN